MMVVVSQSCSWCHAMNSVESRFCHACGHEAQRGRMNCGCPQCRGWQGRAALAPLDVHFTCGYCGRIGTGESEAGADGETWYHPVCWRIVSNEGRP